LLPTLTIAFTNDEGDLYGSPSLAWDAARELAHTTSSESADATEMAGHVGALPVRQRQCDCRRFAGECSGVVGDHHHVDLLGRAWRIDDLTRFGKQLIQRPNNSCLGVLKHRRRKCRTLNHTPRSQARRSGRPDANATGTMSRRWSKASREARTRALKAAGAATESVRLS